MADTIIKLVEFGSWPLVTVIAIIVLGPLGYLEKAANALGNSAQNLIAGIKEAKDNLERVSSETRNFGSNAADLKILMEKINLDVSELVNRTREISEDLDIKNQIDSYKNKEVVEETLTGQNSKEKQDSKRVMGLNIVSITSADPVAMLNDIETTWAEVVKQLTVFGGKSFDGRAVGTYAFSLTHRNRKKPLTSSEAELIARLHGEFKSFTRRRTTVNNWMTPEVYSAFMDSAKIAYQVLQKV